VEETTVVELSGPRSSEAQVTLIKIEVESKSIEERKERRMQRFG
jgi:hypothetical protein